MTLLSTKARSRRVSVGVGSRLMWLKRVKYSLTYRRLYPGTYFCLGVNIRRFCKRRVSANPIAFHVPFERSELDLLESSLS